MLVRVADDDDAIDHNWRRRGRDISIGEIHTLVWIVTVGQIRKQVGQQINHAGFRKAFNPNRAAPIFQRLTGFRVQCRQEKGGRRNIDNTAAIDLGLSDSQQRRLASMPALDDGRWQMSTLDELPKGEVLAEWLRDALSGASGGGE